VNKTQSEKVGTNQGINDFIEPCFFNKEHWIKSPPSHDVETIADYLAHQVSKKPLDLTSHLQRFSLHRHHKHAEKTYAALLDLFVVLGNKGLPLRQRLLLQASRVISREHYHFLLSTLPDALAVTSDTPLHHLAVLSMGRMQEKESVQQAHPADAQDNETPLQIARDLLNSGQINQAQEILESALLATPEDQDISCELLQIYRHTQNRESCIQMLKQLSSERLAAREQWVELIITLDQGFTESSLSA